MKISIIGSGYVGLCTGIGFAMKGHDVICLDKDQSKIDTINSGKAPFYEKDIDENLKKCVDEGKIIATDDFSKINETEISFISVGTPSDDDGTIDLKYVKAVAEEIGEIIKEKDYHVVVVKSTVIPGTTENVIIPLIEEKSGKKVGEFGVCMNPEFLKEGFALDDFLNPDRVVIGEFDKKSGDILEKMYKDFNAPIIRTDIKAAELIKYASNAFLASKISLMNEIGNISKKLDIDVYDVAKGMGYDKRIGNLFLNAGAGFGGSCFSKDISALVHKGKELGYDANILKSVLELNKKQKVRIVDMLKEKLGNLKGKRVCILGLAFKPGTDDIRDATSIDMIRKLLEEGATISCYDPKAIENMRVLYPDLDYKDNYADAIKDSDACVVLTEWDEFKSLSSNDFDTMKNRIIIEGRKILDIDDAEGICW